MKHPSAFLREDGSEFRCRFVIREVVGPLSIGDRSPTQSPRTRPPSCGGFPAVASMALQPSTSSTQRSASPSWEARLLHASKKKAVEGLRAMSSSSPSAASSRGARAGDEARKVALPDRLASRRIATEQIPHQRRIRSLRIHELTPTVSLACRWDSNSMCMQRKNENLNCTPGGQEFRRRRRGSRKANRPHGGPPTALLVNSD